ncbi:MAG: NAD(P)-dependent oxidoreductase [Carboxydocellales bacterium]
MNNKTTKTAVITGASGFIGSHLVQRLNADGWDLHLIIRSKTNLMLIKDSLVYVTLHYHDGSTNGLINIFKSVKPQIVFHLASLFLAQHTPKDIEPMMQSNIVFSTQLVEAMVNNDVFQLVNTGTSWQHFKNYDYNPVCLYAATKQAFETILKFYTDTNALKVINLKLFDTYGLHDPRAKLFTLLQKVVEEQMPFAMSPGEQLIDIVYIDDVIEAFVLAAERLLEDKVKQKEDYAVSSGHPLKLRELVETYGKIIGKPLPIEWGGLPYRTREVMKPWDKGVYLPGWAPKISLEEGIRKLIQNNN